MKRVGKDFALDRSTWMESLHSSKRDFEKKPLKGKTKEGCSWGSLC